MTKLTKEFRREVEGVIRSPLIVTIYPSGIIGIREKRSRREYSLPLATIYRLAVDAEILKRKNARKRKA